MKSSSLYSIVSPLAVACLIGCGGGPTNTVKTKEDAAKISAAMAAATALVSAGGEAACSEGGSVKAETTVGADLLKGEVSTTTTFTFSGCVSQGITFNGSWARVLATNSSGGSNLTNSGHVDTSLGSCIVDLKGTTLSAAVTGMLCGFDYATLI